MKPQWPAPAGVRAFCSERSGGVSVGPYESLNLGDHVGDDAAAVQENRRRYARALQARPVFLRQVHGCGVVGLSADTPDMTEADACWTTERGLACTMMVADCLPVLLAHRDARVVGAAHCGWRGLADGVLEALWDRMAPAARSADQVMAWLGPCIGPQAFEVGPEVREAYVAADAGAGDLFRPWRSGKFLADLPGLARRRLAALGIGAVHGNDGSSDWCTVSQPSRFFSHRRDRVSGRLAASVWLA
jgi:YfiH family protein